MTPIKLDNGDYINTEYVIKTMTDTAGSVGKKGGQLVYLLDTGYQRITTADRDRIVEAMKDHHTPNFTALGEAYGALEMVNQGMKDGAQYANIDGILHVLRMAVNGEEKS